MKKYIIYALLFLFPGYELMAQVKSTGQLIYGKVSRTIYSPKGNYEIPAAKIKVLLVEVSYSGTSFDKAICTRKDYPSQVSVFFTDSKGEYNFRGVKKATKYRLIICDIGSGKVYSTQLQIPPSANRVVRVPDQRI